MRYKQPHSKGTTIFKTVPFPIDFPTEDIDVFNVTSFTGYSNWKQAISLCKGFLYVIDYFTEELKNEQVVQFGDKDGQVGFLPFTKFVVENEGEFYYNLENDFFSLNIEEEAEKDEILASETIEKIPYR